jgi:hypothetical protein
MYLSYRLEVAIVRRSLSSSGWFEEATMKLVTLLAGAGLCAVAGSVTYAGDDQKPAAIVDRGASFFIDRSPGRTEIKIRCAESDSTRDCLNAIFPVLTEGGQGSGSPGVVYATTSLKCGDTIYSIGTGTSGGACGPSAGSNGKGVSCTQLGKEVASANCDTGCGTQTGSGTCSIAAK